MKAVIILWACLISGSTFSQEPAEKQIETEVNEVTIFLDGAQVTRKKTVDLAKGETIIKFINLSPFIEAKSVQVKGEGNITVLSVNHQQNYLDKMEKPTELTDLEKQLENIEDKIQIENTFLSIIREELAFLQENRDIGGKNEQVNIANLQQASAFYSEKLTSLKMNEIERRKTLARLNEEKTDLQNQINTLTSKKEFPTGEILVKADAAQSGNYALEINYLVGNTGWFPTYDIRAKNINEPVQVIYKANVKQDTKVDWKDVKLKFSSAQPNVSGVAPQLKTYFLNYNTTPPNYQRTANSVSGKVLDNYGEPLPGTSVVVEGTTIGTVTDYNGNYSITIPASASHLTFSFIGYQTKTLPINNRVMNVFLEEDMVALEEVVVTAYGSGKRMSDALQGSVAGVGTEDSKIRIRGSSSLAVPTAQVENQTTVDFEINTPYTIPSDNKNYSVDMEVYDLPAFFEYYSVPRIDRDAFLIANIVEWEQYNLMEGEANVFFEGTYVGKTLLDVRYASDTLEISLGRDKNVSVKREKITDFTSKQFIGNKKEEIREWRTTVKNNKNQSISMLLLDQVPVSTLEEIEVTVQNMSGAKHNTETGEIKWQFDLQPNEENQLELKYAVKYPKNKRLVVE